MGFPLKNLGFLKGSRSKFVQNYTHAACTEINAKHSLLAGKQSELGCKDQKKN